MISVFESLEDPVDAFGSLRIMSSFWVNYLFPDFIDDIVAEFEGNGQDHLVNGFWVEEDSQIVDLSGNKLSDSPFLLVFLGKNSIEVSILGVLRRDRSFSPSCFDRTP
jgi:hypothetical protein